MNAYRRNAGETVVPEHDESAGGAPELFYVATGTATFSVGGDEIDAPAGTCVWVTDAEREARRHANADGHARPRDRRREARRGVRAGRLGSAVPRSD